MFSISYETLTLNTANNLYVSIKSKKKIKNQERVSKIFLGKSYSAISAGKEKHYHFIFVLGMVYR